MSLMSLKSCNPPGRSLHFWIRHTFICFIYNKYVLSTSSVSGAVEPQWYVNKQTKIPTIKKPTFRRNVFFVLAHAYGSTPSPLLLSRCCVLQLYWISCTSTCLPVGYLFLSLAPFPLVILNSSFYILMIHVKFGLLLATFHDPPWRVWRSPFHGPLTSGLTSSLKCNCCSIGPWVL